MQTHHRVVWTAGGQQRPTALLGAQLRPQALPPACSTSLAPSCLGANRSCASRATLLQQQQPQSSRQAALKVAAAAASFATAEDNGVLSSEEVVLRFFEAMNMRDVMAVLELVSDDCFHHDLAHDAPIVGRLDVCRFYQDLFASMSSNMTFVVEDITGGDSAKVGVTWHIEIEGAVVPLSNGLSFYRLDEERRICYVRQSPEHFVKCANLAMSASASASPFIGSLGPMALPSFWTNVAKSATNVMNSTPDLGQALMSSFAPLGAGFPIPVQASSIMPVQPTGGRAAPASGRTGASHNFVANAAPFASGQRNGGAPAQAQQQRVGSNFPAARSGGADAAAAARTQPSNAGSVRATMMSGTSTAATPRAYIFNARGTAPPAQPPASSATAAPSVSAQDEVDAAAGASLDIDIVRLDGSVTSIHAGGERVVPGDGSETTSQQAAPEGLHVLRPDGSVVTVPLADAPADVQRPAQGAAASAATDVAAAATPATPAPAAVPANLTGLWAKDLATSDEEGYGRTLDLWGISGIQKATARLIEGLEISHRGSSFDVHFLTIIPMFKVTEKYVIGGRTKVMRRDLRSGEANATAEAHEGGVLLRASFGQPFAGQLEESYLCPEPDVMHVTSKVTVGGKTASTVQVYRRAKDIAKTDLLKQSEQRNGKANDILRKFGMPV